MYSNVRKKILRSDHTKDHNHHNFLNKFIRVALFVHAAEFRFVFLDKGATMLIFS